MNVQARKRVRAGAARAGSARALRPVRAPRRDPGALFDPRLFRALSDPTRLRILTYLLRCRRPCSVSRAAGCCAVDLSVVSRHLAALRQAGILEARRHGRLVRYAVRHAALARALRALAALIEDCCPDRTCCPGCTPQPARPPRLEARP